MNILIVGAGGHAQVIADIFLKQRMSDFDIDLIGFIDDSPRLQGSYILGLPVLGTLNDLPSLRVDAIIIGIGDNQIRKSLFLSYTHQRIRFVSAIHPCATIGHDVKIGDGTVICANTVINTGSEIGNNTIINTGTTIDHHNEIGNHVHVAPGVHTGGEVKVGEGTFIGIGSTIMPRINIQEWATIGAGALVNKDVSRSQTVIGVPAKILYKE